MNIVDRVKNILLTPKTEWEVIAAETSSTADLVTKYVLPLAAIAAIAHFIGSVFIGTSMGFLGTFRMPLTWGIVVLVMQIVQAVVMVFVLMFVIDMLAPSFGGQKNQAQALKVGVYAMTAGWVAGIFSILPMLGWLVGLIGLLYGLYLLYLGLPRLMKSPEDKTIGYTIVVVIVAIVVGFIINVVIGLITAPAMLGAAAVSGGGFGKSRPEVTFQKDSAMGKLDEFAKRMEEAGKKMESAEKSGDPNKQAQAAMEALGTALSGGKRVQPLSLEEAKAFVPETFAGLPKTGSKAQRSGPEALMVTNAEATYGDASGKTVRLEITDTGGASGMMGFAAWAGAMNVDKEDDNSMERTRKEGNRVVHERVSKRGGSNEFSLILGDRFIVKAVGTGVDIGALKSGVGSLNLAKLEALKDAGVAKN